MMKEKIKKIPIGIRAAIVYTLASVISKGLAIITVPIFTRIMSTDQIGAVNLYNSWNSLISVVVTLSLTSGGYQAAMREFEGEREQYQSSVLSLTTLMAIIISIIYLIRPSLWNNITGLPTNLMMLMLVGFIFAPAQDFWLARQRYEYKYKLPGILTVISAIVASAFSIFTVLKLNSVNSEHIVEGRLYANSFVILTIAFIIWVYIFAKGKTIYNKKFWMFSLKLSIPLIGYSIASQVLSVSDRMMISSMVGNSAVGIYSTLYTVSSMSLLVWSAINASFIPYLYQNIENPKNKIKSISISLMGLYGILAITLTFLAPEIVKILATEEYYKAIYIMPPIAAGVFLTSVTNMYSNILIYFKKTQYIMYSSIIAAIVNIILNFVFIDLFGYMAAAYTTLVAYVVLALLQVYWALKIQKLKNVEIYNNKLVFLLSIGTILISLSGLILYQATLIRYIFILMGLFFGIIAGFNYFKIRK